MVVQPVGVASGVSNANAFPICDPMIAVIRR
jgi:hypothetical protein